MSKRDLPISDEENIERLLFVSSFTKAKNDSDLKSYKDPFTTKEQKERDSLITKLLNRYVNAYETKVSHSVICRYLILVPCILIVVLFGVAVFWGFLQILKVEKEIPIANLTAFITACVSFVTSVIGVLSIITKYFFPENDEQYITKIVESIQKNDLENKKENAKNKSDLEKNDSAEKGQSNIDNQTNVQ